MKQPIWVAGWIGLASLTGVAEVRYAGPETCAACHEEEFAAWRGSIHARAFSEKFKKVWKESGGKVSCLTCHTTGLRRSDGHFEYPGVTCESCHGRMAEGHPAEAKMPIPVSADMCAACHRRTHQEWNVSRHGRKGVRCFDCHQVHAQGLRAGGGDKLCGSCHPGRLKDFAHATHHLEGLRCATCHFPDYAGAEDAIEGTGASGHALSVGPEVCARCHEETVHRGSRLPDLRETVGDLKRHLAVAGAKSVFELSEQLKQARWEAARLNQSVWLAAVAGAVAGFSLGWLISWWLQKRKGSR